MQNRRVQNINEKTLSYIVHVPGKKNVGPDAASRYPTGRVCQFFLKLEFFKGVRGKLKIYMYINGFRANKNNFIHFDFANLAPKGVHEKITNGLLTFILSLLGKN